MRNFKARVMCYFDIEIEADDIELAKECTEMSIIEEVLYNKTEESIERIRVTDIREIN